MPADFRRDRYGRPLVLALAPADAEHAYMRPSSFGQVLDDQYVINTWKLRTAATGLTLRPDLLAQFAATAALDEKGNSRKLDALVDDCIEAAGGNRGRRLGEALHTYIEMTNKGIEVNALEPWDRDLAAYVAMLATWGLRPVAELVEIAVVNDTYRTAGSPDVFLEVVDPEPLQRLLSGNIEAGDVFVADPKTGKTSPTSNQYSTQQYLYATSQRYDLETGERSPIHPRLRTDIGFLIHLPAGQAECHLYVVDLIEAAQRTELAKRVRNAMKDVDYVTKLTFVQGGNLVTPPVAPKAPPYEPPTITVPANTDLVGRLQLITMVDNGKTVLGELWVDAELPFPPKHLDQHLDNVELMQRVNAVLAKAEDLLAIPFNEVVEPPKPKKRSKKPAGDILDEGNDADPEAITLFATWLKEQDDDVRNVVKQIASDATKHGTSISLAQRKTVRRFEIARAIKITVEFTEGIDNNIIEVLDGLLHYIGHAQNVGVGERLGHLDVTAAAALSDAAAQLAAGHLLLVFNDDGAFRFRPNR